MERTKDEEIEYCFTRYLQTAVQRARKDYLNKEMKMSAMEEVGDSGLFMEVATDMDWTDSRRD